MCTRAKAGVVNPRLHPTLLHAHFEPKSTKIALSNPTWFATMKTEHDALMKNGTWTLTKLAPSTAPIGCTWVFRVKENPDGTINKYKARLVAKGFHKKLGNDYNETFSCNQTNNCQNSKATRAWFDKPKATLLQYNFRSSRFDTSLFI
ncbi:uncharacterized mitochondrial protein AtMg00820-like [Glycine max]|uniref:uncharacterized mitochondrial protein AtMg00820-like n=1 Tax=Glycine max TaxID=3847 RepID=UPI0003DECF95|nr:uncharacterized mitochondrial protein AtMg00820-like [Glycine max]|eukprot:XP_006603409.1 uncharacterized protein LOC102662352 [Glycine max]